MFTALAALAVPALVAVLPSAAAQTADLDLTILNYALTLEHLESTFYTTGLQNYSVSDFVAAGFNESVRSTIDRISFDEAEHVATLTEVINAAYPGKAVPPCTYTFPSIDVKSFLTVASALENTGVSAYDGAIHLITSPAYKTAGASIATIEGRHASFLDNVNNVPIALGPFDTPLGFKPVVSIASAFIVSCPYTLPVTAFPALAVNISGPTITATSDALASFNGTKYCTFVYGLGQNYTELASNSECCIPDLIADSGFVEAILFITNSTMPVTLDDDSAVLAGPAIIPIPAKPVESLKSTVASGATRNVKAAGVFAISAGVLSAFFL